MCSHNTLWACGRTVAHRESAWEGGLFNLQWMRNRETGSDSSIKTQCPATQFPSRKLYIVNILPPSSCVPKSEMKPLDTWTFCI